jgi:hypothetical protein
MDSSGPATVAFRRGERAIVPLRRCNHYVQYSKTAEVAGLIRSITAQTK